MIRAGVVSLLMLGMLSACGHTPEERLVSGALIGGAIGAVVGLSNEPRHNGFYERDRRHDRRYERRHHRRSHRDGSWRRNRGYGYYN